MSSDSESDFGDENGTTVPTKSSIRREKKRASPTLEATDEEIEDAPSEAANADIDEDEDEDKEEGEEEYALLHLQRKDWR